MRDIQLEPGEKLIIATRKHWFVLLLRLIPIAFLAWLPSVLLVLLSVASATMPGASAAALTAATTSPYAHLFYGLWLLMLWSTAFNFITSYYLNEWIITSTRIIEIHQYGFFSREISSLLLVKIQDVDVDVQGLLGTLVGYGQLQVQSAGTAEHFSMEDIPEPNGLRDTIMKEIALLHADGRQFVNTSTASVL